MNFNNKHFLDAALAANVPGLTKGLASLLEHKLVSKHTGDGDLTFVVLPYLDDCGFYGQLLVFKTLQVALPIFVRSFALTESDKLAFKGEFGVNWNGTVVYVAGIKIPEGNATSQDECVLVYSWGKDCELLHALTCKSISGIFDYGKSISCTGDGRTVAILSSSFDQYDGFVQVKTSRGSRMTDWQHQRVHFSEGSSFHEGDVHLSKDGRELSVWEGDVKMEIVRVSEDTYSF